jgi:hypothetical protein
MLYVISEENKMKRTAVCDNIIYGWKKNEEQEEMIMMKTSFSLTGERTEWNCNLYSFLNLQEF